MGTTFDSPNRLSRSAFVRPLTQAEAAVMLAAIPTPSPTPMSLAADANFGGVLTDFSSGVAYRNLEDDFLYQVIRCTGSFPLNLVNTGTTQDDVNAIIAQVKRLHDAEGWTPRIALNDNPYFQSGSAFDDIPPTDTSNDTQVANFIDGKLDDFSQWLKTAIDAQSLDWTLDAANDLIYVMDHEVWPRGGLSQAEETAQLARLANAVSAYTSHANPAGGWGALSGGTWSWYMWQGIEYLQAYNGWYDPPNNAWLPVGATGDVPGTLFPDANVRQCWQTWQTMYPWAVFHLCRLNDEWCVDNAYTLQSMWASLSWCRAIDRNSSPRPQLVEPSTDGRYAYYAPVRGKDIYHLGRILTAASSTVMWPTNKIDMIHFWPAIVPISDAPESRWQINGFVNFVLGMAQTDDSHPLAAMLGDEWFDAYGDIVLDPASLSVPDNTPLVRKKAGENLERGRMVRLDANGEAVKADAQSLSNADVYGMAFTDVADGQDALILTRNVTITVAASTFGMIGEPLFLSPTAGEGLLCKFQDLEDTHAVTLVGHVGAGNMLLFATNTTNRARSVL